MGGTEGKGSNGSTCLEDPQALGRMLHGGIDTRELLLKHESSVGGGRGKGVEMSCIAWKVYH